MAFIVEDKTKRPGVSIHLETQVFRQNGDIIISPSATREQNKGIDVLVATKVTKIGKSVGFCDITMHSADGHTLLAKGSHVKFLPMGALWDWLFHPVFLPFFMFFLNSIPRYFKAMIAPNFKHEGPPQIEKKTIFEELNVSEDGSFKVNPVLCNPVGALHGGALAVACEEVIARKIGDGQYISDLEIKYLRSMKGNVRVEVDDEDLSESRKCHGVVKNKKGQLCAQFSARLSNQRS